MKRFANLPFFRQNAAPATTLAVLALLGLASPLAAQATSPARPSLPPQTPAVAAKPVAAEEEQPAKLAKAGTEGIKIHGHWVLELKGKDGKTVDRREFNNSLVTGGLVAGGDQLLALLLSGNGVVGDPGVFLVQGTYPYADASRMCLGGAGTTCYMLTTAASPLGQALPGINTFPFNALNATFQTGLNTSITLTPGVSWVLTGNFVVPSAMTSVNFVQTVLPMCTPQSSTVSKNFNNGGTTDAYSGTSPDDTADIGPKACSGLNPSGELTTPIVFTSTGVPGTSMTTTAGQTITVTVTITFS